MSASSDGAERPGHLLIWIEKTNEHNTCHTVTVTVSKVTALTMTFFQQKNDWSENNIYSRRLNIFMSDQITGRSLQLPKLMWRQQLFYCALCFTVRMYHAPSQQSGIQFRDSTMKTTPSSPIQKGKDL
jgi:hypothetical protein